MPAFRENEIFGLLKPTLDAHSLGLTTFGQLLEDCGYRAAIADADISRAADRPAAPGQGELLEGWIKRAAITRLGFSYRLDPREGAELFGGLVYQLERRKLLAERGGPIVGLYFAGLPEACDLVKREWGERVEVFYGDETPGETLAKVGIPLERRPREMAEAVAYDESRLAFARELIGRGQHLTVRPVDRSGYEGYGARSDSLLARLQAGEAGHLPPLMRAHVGPYQPERIPAVQQCLDWCRQLAQAGLLDILSIGTSQLSQSAFGEAWGDRPNGGGVPINSPQEYRAVWEASRPMLVRTYAGTKDIPRLARLYEETINIAWHALSFWWFCQIDGRGTYSVQKNLAQHIETLGFIAASGKPFEPNIPHHFAFRGADDITYIVSAVLAARTAKALGVKCLILQNMLNTPKATWGLQDLAKSRALLALVRELEEENFKVILQPRAGLEYFSHDPEKAKIQLAAVSALMADIEPQDSNSPPIIHVVSYSEGSRLADPAIINESIQITRAAISEYRRCRARGEAPDMSRHPEVEARTEELLSGGRAILRAIEAVIPAPYTAEGLYQIMRAGFLPVPYLWEGREEFSRAVSWKTRLIKGSVKVVDERGLPISPQDRAQAGIEASRGGELLRPGG